MALRKDHHVQRSIPLEHGAPPLHIEDDEWPNITSASTRSGSFKCWLRVRQHEDGRALVYGGTEQPDRAGGEIVAAGEDLAVAIRRVGKLLEASDECMMQCIAGLPS